MKENLIKLVTLQGFDKEIRGILDVENEGAQKIREKETRVEKAKEQLAEKERELREKEIAVTRAEEEVKALEQQYKERNYALMSTKDTKSYDALKAALQDIRDHINETENTSLEIMGEIDTLKEKNAAFKEKIAGEEKKIEELKEQMKEGQKERDEKIAELRQKAQEYEKSLPADILAVYQRMLNMPDRRAIVPLVDRACSGCFSNVTPEEFSRIKIGDSMITCGTCGRIVYIPEVLGKADEE